MKWNLSTLVLRSLHRFVCWLRSGFLFQHSDCLEIDQTGEMYVPVKNAANKRPKLETLVEPVDWQPPRAPYKASAMVDYGVALQTDDGHHYHYLYSIDQADQMKRLIVNQAASQAREAQYMTFYSAARLTNAITATQIEHECNNLNDNWNNGPAKKAR